VNTDGNDILIKAAIDIVVAYVSHNSLTPDEVQKLIQSTYVTLSEIAQGDQDSGLEDYEPAVPIDESVTDDVIICLEDGLPFKSLKRHLRSKYDLTPEAYRQKWKLPLDYPMVAPNYAKKRSDLAKKSGLGRGPRQNY